MVDNKSKTSFIRHIQKKISLMKINNIILVLRSGIIIISSFMIYFFCICHTGSFAIVVIASFHTDIVTHTSNTFLLGLTTYQLNIPKISKKGVW